MTQHAPMRSTTVNTLLASLPRKVYLQMLPSLLPVTLGFGQVLHEHGAAIEQVYFPEKCVVSLLVVVGESALEVALVGYEGLAGLPLALGVELSPVRALVQGEGAALRMSRTRFRAALGQHPSLQRAVYGYAGSLMGQIGQTAACNRFHKVHARLARWLLMTRDRLGSGEFRVTQEFLSAMLGVRRVGVSEAASAFQHQHLIEYSRGVITILDHPGLESACCSCYAVDAARAGAMAKWRPPSAVSTGLAVKAAHRLQRAGARVSSPGGS
jgi:CRP-like cAMP-binding protein